MTYRAEHHLSAVTFVTYQDTFWTLKIIPIKHGEELLVTLA